MKCNILVVEDNFEVRSVLEEILEMEGYEVTTARNGREALDYLKQQTPPELIILDLMMPEVDGWTFRRKQIEQQIHPDIPLIVLTGVMGKLTAHRPILNAASAMTKPVTPEELLAAVKRHC